MQGAPEQFDNYLKESDPNNDHEVVSLGWKTFIKKDSLFKEFPEMLQNDLGFPKGMASNAMGELLQVLKEINDVRDLKGEEFVESWLYHQIGQFLGLTIGDLFVSVLPQIKRICNDDKARQQYLKELCSRNQPKKIYQDFFQKIQKSSIYSQLNKLSLIESMHKDLKEEWEQVKGNPDLAEHTILKMMLANFQSRNHKVLKEAVFTESQRNIKIQELDELALKIKDEGSQSHKAQRHIEECKQFFEDKDTNSNFYDTLNSLKKQINIIDDFLLKKLMDQTQKQNVKGKDIILLIGPTGAGKTTLILWLLGYKMVTRYWGQLKTLVPEKQPRPEHQALLANPGSKSVTRFIYSTKLSYPGQSQGERLQICDSPGFFDSASTEVDITNGIGMINAIKKCKSVKPVIVFNGQALGHRKSAVKDIASIVSKLFFVTQFKQVQYNIGFIFNKFTADSLKQFKPAVKDLIKNLEQNQRNDKKYFGFLNYLYETLSKHDDPNVRLVFNPDSQEITRQSWIQKLKSSPIFNPDEIFQYTYSPQSKQKIEKAAQKHSKRIIAYIGGGHFRENISSVFYYYKKLKRIYDIVTGDIKHIYDQIVNKLETHYQQLFNQFSKHLKEQVLTNEANAKTFESMKNIKEEVEEFHKIFSKQLDLLRTPKQIGQLIIQQEKHLQKQFQKANFQPDMDETKLQMNLAVVKKSTCFSNSLKKNITDIFKKKYQQSNDGVSQRIKTLSFQDFQGAGWRYLKICKWKSLDEDKKKDHYQQHFKDQMNKRLEVQKNTLVEFIHQKISKVEKQGGNLQIQQNHFETLKRDFQRLKKLDSCPFLEGTNCKQINHEILNKLIQEGEKIMDKVVSILHGDQINQTTINDIGILIRNRDKLVAIEAVKAALKYHIQNCNDSMKRICQSEEKAINGILSSLRDETLTQNLGAEVARSYQRIRSLLSLSTDGAFIQKVKEVQKSLRDKMLLYLSEVIQKIQRLYPLNIADKKRIQPKRIKSTIIYKKYIDFFSSLGLFQDKKNQIENIKNQISQIILKPFDDMKLALSTIIPLMLNSQEEDNKKFNQISITLRKLQNFLLYKNIFMEIFWNQQTDELRMRQIIDNSKQFFDIFVKPIRLFLKNESLATLCKSESKHLKFLQRSLNFLKKLKQSTELAPYLQLEIDFHSQHEYQSVQDFIQEKIVDLRFLIQKASREQNQKQMVNYLQYAKNMCTFDKLLNESQRQGQSFDSIKKQLESKIKNAKQESVKSFGDLINDEHGLDLKEIQFFYNRFKQNWKIDVSTSKVYGTEAEVISGQIVSKLHNYFKNQQRILDYLLEKMLQDTSNRYFAHQETSRYLATVDRVSRQLIQIMKILEKEPVKDQFEPYLLYIKTKSLIEYQKQVDGQIDQIIQRIEEFRLKQIKNRLRRFKEVENQIKKTVGPQFFDERLVNLKEKVKKESKIEQKQGSKSVFEYLWNYYQSRERKRSQILELENGEKDLLNKGVKNIYSELEIVEREKFKLKIENLLLEMQQQIEIQWNLGKKMIDQKQRLNDIMENLPNEIRSKFSRDLEKSKKQIQANFTKLQTQITAKISDDKVDFQLDLIKPYRQIQINADAKLLEKYAGFTRQYFKTQEKILEKIGIISQFLNIFQEKILALKPIIFQNKNSLQQVQVLYTDCETRMATLLPSLLRKKCFKEVKTYLQKGKISGPRSIEDQIQQIFVVYDVLQTHLQNNDKFLEETMKFLKAIAKQYEQFIFGWQKDVSIEMQFSKNVLTQKLTKYIIYSEVASILSKQIQSKDYFSEIYDVLTNDAIKGKLDVLRQKIKSMIKNICNIKFYSDQLKSMNQAQLTKYLQDYEKDLQRLKKFQQVFVGERSKFMEVAINIEDLQNRIIGQWQRQNSSTLQNLEQFLQNFDRDMRDISNHCNVLDLVFKVSKEKKISPLWKKFYSLNQLPLMKQIENIISGLQQKCSQSERAIAQATSQMQRQINQEEDQFRTAYNDLKKKEQTNNIDEIDKCRTEISKDSSLKPEEKNRRIQTKMGNIEKLTNDKLREKKMKHETLMSGKKNTLIQSQEVGLREIAINLVKIKRISFYIRRFSKANNGWMNGFLKQLGHKNRQRMVNLEKYLRETKAEVEVEMIVNDSGAFAFIKAETYVRQTKAQDIEYLLREIPEIRQNFTLVDKYRRQYRYYQDEYSRIQENYKLDCTSEFKRLLAEDIKKKGSLRQYKKSMLVAKIFALWSILKLDDDKSEIVFSFNPHPAQIMAILFLINCFEGKEKIKNRFAEVLTGEGKSVVLAGLCSYLAVCGYKAYCACYSEYLSMRDNQEFRTLFQTLGILDKVKYGPFNVHCQDFLNAEEADKSFKESIKQFIITEQSLLDKMKSFFGSFFESLANKFNNKDKLQKRVLIIDEVDVFFDQKFYGQIYRPAITLDSEQIQNLLLQVWQLKNSGKLTVKEVENSQNFKKVTERYPHLKSLLKNQLNGIIRAAEDPTHSYLVNNESLCYIDNQSISYDINYGFKTVFANCLQYDQKRVSLSNRKKSLKISLIVGQFSYAELPKYFKSILGVSGTINAIPQYKKTDMRDLYNITEFLSIPSIYRKKLVTESYQIAKNESFDKILSQQIQKVYKENRPVIVFFSGVKEMQRYRSQCAEFKNLKSFSYSLSQETENDHRDQIIQRAGQKGMITLITSSFARGTDFKIYEKSVIEAGGLHVIQTYLSMNESDFIQVKGRTARQGKDGSFGFILKESDLQLLEIKYDERLPIPDQLRRAWKLNDEKIGTTYKQKLIKATAKHSQNVRRFSKNASQAQWIDYILNLNGYEEIKHHHVRTVIGIDGTVSMRYALRDVLPTIQRVVQRISAILQGQKFNGSQEIEIVIYRNYGQGFKLLLQSSGFESSATKLTEFLRKITASGGQGNQALEVLFQYINRRENVSQVIVIGDAAPNTRDEVKIKRSFKSQLYWNQHNFPMTTSEDQMKKIIQNKIPIHSFYLKRGDYFSSLSRDTGGHSEQFVLNSPNTEKSLIDFFSAHILKALDPSEKLLNVYAEKYEYRKRY